MSRRSGRRGRWDGGGVVDRTSLPTYYSGLLAWQSAANAGDFTLSGAEVTQWNDLSGMGNHSTGSAGSAPSRVTDATLGGLHVVSATTSKSLVGAAAIGSALAGADVPSTFVMLCRFAAHATADIYSLAGKGVHTFGRTSAARYAITRTDDAASSATPAMLATDPSPDYEWRVVALRFSGTSATLWIDGTVSSVLALDVATASFPSVAETYSQLAVRERAIYARDLSDAECAALAAGMRSRASLATPTGILAQPGVEGYVDESHGVTVTDATYQTDVSAWGTRTGIASVTDQGGGYYRVTEDTSNGGHDVRGAVTNLALGPASIGYRIKKTSTVSHVRIGTFESASYIRLSDGAVTAGVGPHTMVVTDGGTYWQVTHRPTAMSASTPLLLPQLADGGVTNYVGTGKWAEWAMIGADGLATGTLQRRHSGWATRTLSGQNLAQATAAAQPFLWDPATSTWVATPGPYFGGVSTFGANGIGTALSGLAGATVSAVHDRNGAAANARIWSGDINEFSLKVYGTMVVLVGTGPATITSNAAVDDGSRMVSTVTFDAGTLSLRRNGSDVAVTASGSPPATLTAMARFDVGTYNGTTEGLVGNLRRMAWHNRPLTAAEKTVLEAELAA